MFFSTVIQPTQHVNKRNQLSRRAHHRAEGKTFQFRYGPEAGAHNGNYVYFMAAVVPVILVVLGMRINFCIFQMVIGGSALGIGSGAVKMKVIIRLSTLELLCAENSLTSNWLFVECCKMVD